MKINIVLTTGAICCHAGDTVHHQRQFLASLNDIDSPEGTRRTKATYQHIKIRLSAAERAVFKIPWSDASLRMIIIV